MLDSQGEWVPAFLGSQNAHHHQRVQLQTAYGLTLWIVYYPMLHLSPTLLFSCFRAKSESFPPIQQPIERYVVQGWFVWHQLCARRLLITHCNQLHASWMRSRHTNCERHVRIPSAESDSWGKSTNNSPYILHMVVVCMRIWVSSCVANLEDWKKSGARWVTVLTESSLRVQPLITSLNPFW